MSHMMFSELGQKLKAKGGGAEVIQEERKEERRKGRLNKADFYIRVIYRSRFRSLSFCAPAFGALSLRPSIHLAYLLFYITHIPYCVRPFLHSSFLFYHTVLAPIRRLVAPEFTHRIPPTIRPISSRLKEVPDCIK